MNRGMLPDAGTRRWTRRSFFRRAAAAASLVGLSPTWVSVVQGSRRTVRIAASRGIVSCPVWNLVNHAPRYGFSVEMSVLFTYADQQRAVQSYQTEAATAGITQPAILADQGIRNVRYIAGQQWGGQNLIVRRGVDVRSWKDLEGKRIGLVPGTYAAILFLIAARENGVDLSRVSMSNVAAGATATEALRGGDLDGLVLFSPMIDQAVVEGYAYYPPNVDIGTTELGPANGGILANDRFLADDDLTDRFLRAYIDSVTEMRRDEEAFVRVATEVAGIDPAVAREAKTRITFDYRIDLEAIRRASAYGVEFGFTRRDVAEQVEQWVDVEPLQRVTGRSRDELIGTPPDALRMIGRG